MTPKETAPNNKPEKPGKRKTDGEPTEQKTDQTKRSKKPDIAAEAKKPLQRKFRSDLQELQKQKEQFVARALGNLPMSDKAYAIVKEVANSYPPETQKSAGVGRQLAQHVVETIRLGTSPEEAVQLVMHLAAAYGSTAAERAYFIQLITKIQEQYQLTNEQIIRSVQALGASTQIKETVVHQHAEEFANEIAAQVKMKKAGLTEAFKAGKQREITDILNEGNKQSQQEEKAKARHETDSEADNKVYVGEGKSEPGKQSPAEPFESETKQSTVVIYEAKADKDIEQKKAAAEPLGETIQMLVYFLPQQEEHILQLERAINQKNLEEQTQLALSIAQFIAQKLVATDDPVEREKWMKAGLGLVRLVSAGETRDQMSSEKRGLLGKLAKELGYSGMTPIVSDAIVWPKSGFSPENKAAAIEYIYSMKRRLAHSPLGEDPQFWLKEMNFVGGPQSPFTPAQQESLLAQFTQQYERAIAMKIARRELQIPYRDITEARQDIEQFRRRQLDYDPELRLKELLRIQERLLTSEIDPSSQDYIDLIKDISQAIQMARKEAMIQKEFGRSGVYTSLNQVATAVGRYEELCGDLSPELRARILDEIRDKLVWSNEADIPHNSELYRTWLNKIKQLEAELQEELTMRANRRTGLDKAGLDYVRANQEWIEHNQNIDRALNAKDATGKLRIKDETTRKHIREGKKTFNVYELGKHIDAIQNRLQGRPLLQDERQAVEGAIGKIIGKTKMSNKDLQKELGKLIKRLNKLTPDERKIIEDMLQQLTGQKIFKNDEIIKHLGILQKRVVSKMPKMQKDEVSAINEVLQDLIRRKELFAHAFEPFVEAVKEYKRLAAEINEILNEKDKNNIFILQNRKVREAINMALSARTKAELERYMGELDQLILAGLPVEENNRARRAVGYLTRQLELLQFIPQEGQMADYHMRQVGLKEEDIYVLEKLLNTEQLINELRNDPDKFLEYWDGSLEAINTIFRAADRLRHLPFDQSVTPLVEEPMFKQLANMILRAKDNLNEYIKSGRSKDIVVSVKFKENGKWVIKPTKLSEALEILGAKIYADREVREFTHNARYILYIRGSVEDMAKFSSRIKTNTLEAAFFGEEDEAVYVAARFYEKLMMKRLSDDTWVINPEFFQEKNGRIKLDLEVEKLMRQHFGDKLPDWKLERAMAMGGGTATAITGALVCWLATADPPRASRFFHGYFGDSLLGSIEYNRHHAFRWWVQAALKYNYDAQGKFTGIDVDPTNPIATLFFIQMQKSPLFKGWSPHKLMEKFKEHALDMKTGLNQQDRDRYLPFIEISNFFKVGPAVYREGWRYSGLLEHHFVMEDGAPKFLDKDFFNWAKVDLEETWKNIARAGSGALNWYIKAIKGAQSEGMLQGKTIFGLQLSHNENSIKQVHKALMKRLLLDMLGRNPLRFIYLDPTTQDSQQLFEDQESPESLRKKALTKLQAIQTANPNRLIRANIDTGSADVERWELDSMVITETLMRYHVWSLEELQNNFPDAFQELRNRLGKLTAKDRNWGGQFPSSMPYRLDEAWEYWKAIQDVFIGSAQWNNWVANRDTQAITDTGWLTTFADQKLPYGFGTEDMDLTEVNWSGPGGSVVARSWSDMHRIVEKAVLPMFNVEAILTEANATQSFEPIINYIKQAGEAELSVHGPSGRDEVVYGLALFFIRYFDKDWRAQLPFGIGTLWSLRQIFNHNAAISLSRLDSNIMGWAWDEGTTRAFIDRIVLECKLPATEVSKLVAEKQEYNANRLYDEAGARKKQVLWGGARVALPTAFLLFALAIGVTALMDLKEEREAG